ncbi:hypothetical protein ACFVP8_20325 [Viridibacillus arvi]|uniref:hypothetical protein n=1 Tax=Viridibacillus arvi TaxID=263475 RepID=UPI0036A63475
MIKKSTPHFERVFIIKKVISLLIVCICLLAISFGFDADTSYAKAKPVSKDFLLNKNKIYTYQSVTYGKQTIKYVKADDYEDYGIHYWEFVEGPPGYAERQNKDGYYFFLSTEWEGHTVTTKPVKGKKYKNEHGYYYVTSANATVKTKYKTFKNCMAVGSKNGVYTEYYAPHYGLIKIVDKSRKGSTVQWELISVKNKKK